MTPMDSVGLTSLMRLTSGSPAITIGLIDGPIVGEHPDLAFDRIRTVPGKLIGTCARASSAACKHGTFVAGILCGKRNSVAPAICPGCTLLLRPIFTESTERNGAIPTATPEELATAIIECIDAGAGVLNMSIALAQPSSKGERELEEALDLALRRGVLAVAAAGNQGAIGSTAITRHPWVIPVVACNLRGRPISQSNLGNSIGRRGLSAPGENITSLGSDGKAPTFGGTSVAAPFVTGAIGLLWSEFPAASAADVKIALMHGSAPRRSSVVPSLLNAQASYDLLASAKSRRRTA